jgi:RimJ/RimL family protein N-acetyltransferase
MDARRSNNAPQVPKLPHPLTRTKEIQKATASEPLTLKEEYAMQRSWRQDADKLTFIACTTMDESHDENKHTTSHSTSLSSITPGKQDAPEHMIGDVNLFLYDNDDDEEEDEDEDEDEEEENKEIKPIIGELEIMIASPTHRGKGLGQETLRSFMSYIQSSLSGILAEYAAGKHVVLKYLRVKIDQDNVRSVGLFERVGFVRTSAEPNYFGEVELRTPVVDGRLVDVEGKVGLEGFGRKVVYGL